LIFNRQIHTNKQTALLILVTILLFLCTSAKAYTYEVIVVKSAAFKPYNDVLKGFRKACNCEVRELKLVEDEKQITVEKISRLAPDAVLAIGTDAFKKVKPLKDIPVIYTMGMPSEADISLQKNISGVSMDISPETYIATMVEIFPKAKRIGLIYDPQQKGKFVKKALEAANQSGVELVPEIAQKPSDMPPLLDGMHGKIDILWMLPDPTVVNSESLNYMLLFSFKNKVPVFTFSRKYAEMGALAALNIDPFDMGVQAGELARMLSEGHKGSIRVYAKKAHLIINNKIAKKLGINIYKKILKRAEVIE
jgi:putative ABC transport system substrate-binding protein